VYNYKRHGDYKLGNRSLQFVRRPYVPEKTTREFLLVDLANNVKHIAEDQPALVENIKKKAREMDKVRLRYLVRHFGTAGTRKMLDKDLV
jgi:hypothetical protein